MLAACCFIFKFDGVGPAASAVIDDLNGLLEFSEPLRFKRSRASSSDSENSLKCFGRNGTGVETREVKNCTRH